MLKIMKELTNVRKPITYTLAIAGVMSALTILLSLIPLIGYIRITPFVSFTTLHIPVILAGIFGGPIAGMIVGCVFGINSLINAATTSAPTWLTPFLIDPRCSVLPRILIGLVAGLIYKGMGKIKFLPKTINAACSGLFGTFTNTAGLFTALYIFKGKQIVDVLVSKVGESANGKSYVGIIAALLGFGPLVEAIGAAVICVIIVGTVGIGSYAKKHNSKLSRNTEGE